MTSVDPNSDVKYIDDSISDKKPVVSNTHKTWEQFRLMVKESRKLQSNLVSRVPSNFTIKTSDVPERGKITRIFFTAVPLANIRENSLHYIDIPHDTLEKNDSLLNWNMVLYCFHNPEPYKYNKEEQLLRERKRLGSAGITSYDINTDTGSLVFPCYSGLYYTKFYPHMAQSVVARDIRGSCPGTISDPKLCPINSDVCAFVSNHDLWVVNTVLRSETQLTAANYDFKTNPVSCGSPPFVIQEEFDRYTGYWWQPKPKGYVAGKDEVYRILYEEVDESDVQVFHIVSPTTDTTTCVDEYRYPTPGSPNARSTLKMVEFTMTEYGQEYKVHNIVRKSMTESLSTIFPWMEYIVRLDWTPCGQYIWAQLLDRKQERLELVLVPLSAFIENDVLGETSNDVEMSNNDILENGGSNTSLPMIPCMSYQVLYQETSAVWINVNDIIHFLPQSEEDEISFIWASEETGFRHLYRVTSSIAGLVHKSSGTIDQETECQCPHVTSKVQLTRGQWEVAKAPITVDERRGNIFFTAYMDTPLETHMYMVPYKSYGECIRLTEPGFSHVCTMDSECDWIVDVFSSTVQPTSAAIYRINYTPEGAVPVRCGYLLNKNATSSYMPPEIISFTNDQDVELYAMVYKPHNYEEGKVYPTIQFVYGGPEVQLVTNAFKGLRYNRLHNLAAVGYAVVVIDGRGSSHRGVQFECHIKNQMGTVEIQDQVDGLYYIAKQVGYIDLERVAIHGWSYGGYLSLLGLSQRPDVYKLAIAGAPVVSWECYDTGYTERYMDTPQNNPKGYKMGSVLQYINQFPSEEKRLLIIHGLIDENVHFYNTSQLINALVKSCKPYDLQVYPNERHGIRNSEASEHYETTVLSFLQRNL